MNTKSLVRNVKHTPIFINKERVMIYLEDEAVAKCKDQATSRFIVRACNNFEAMLEALKLAQKWHSGAGTMADGAELALLLPSVIEKASQ